MPSHDIVVLGPPSAPSLKELAQSALLVFELLRPWYKSDPASLALKSIKHQAQAYVKAIGFSITAAQHGFNVAEEVLTFAELINYGTEDERQEYLRGMLDIARQGEQNAISAHHSFRDVRVTILQLIREAKDEQHPGSSNTVAQVRNKELGDLENGIAVLEKLSSCIAFYISWWSTMKMCHISQTSRQGRITVQYNSLLQADVMEKWRRMRQDYVDYTNQIEAIQDAAPQFIIQRVPFIYPGETKPGHPPEGGILQNSEVGSSLKLEDLTIMDCEDLDGPGKLNSNDIVILVMGPVGVGKSSIIDRAVRQDKRVGHRLKSYTEKVGAVRIKSHPKHGDRIVLVDTPGFNDTEKTDQEILTIIGEWLVTTYKAGICLQGVIYAHRITDIRMSGAQHLTLRMLQDLSGEKAARNIIFATTMWDDVESTDVGVKREEHLKKTYWSAILGLGGSAARFDNTMESAWEILDNMLAKPAKRTPLQFQEEMVDLRKNLQETKAFTALT